MIMKKLFFSLVALVIATVSYAQSTLVATLTHGDEIKMFYGVKALQQAHAAAVDGDIINLSGGKFEMGEGYSNYITKGITIRGTGVNSSNHTTISTILYIQIPESTKERLSVEGCIFEGEIRSYGFPNGYFLKNHFRNTFKQVYSSKNAMFVNCSLSGYTPNGCSSQFINSYVYDYVDQGSGSQAKFVNCVMDSYSAHNYIKNSELINCIIVYSRDTTTGLPASNTAWNCVACGSINGTDIREMSYSIFNKLAFKQNCSLAGKDIFIDSNHENDLTDEAKATYLGNDGTPVGRYGGPFPFSWTPTYPQITKMNVANKTTADGKLSVEIEVSATE